MQKRFFLNPLFFFIFINFFFLACYRNQISPLAREQIFTFQIGRLEDQIAIHNVKENHGTLRTNFTMRDGLFYISDGNGEKIVRYNSYGDPLFMIYNGETNPTPMTLITLEKMPKDEIITRWAFTHPLQSPGKIAVDSRKHIYVEDKLPNNQQIIDNENRTLLDNIILHFNENGEYIKYLGREGINGSPFPKIEGIYASIENELVIICRLVTGWNIYWFDSDGIALYLIKINDNDIPSFENRQVFSVIDTIIASPDERKLYIKVNYYQDTFDELTNIRSGNDPHSSVIWVMNIENGTYHKSIELPLYEYVISENNQQTTIKMFYSLLGVIQNERIFLQFPVENGYTILLLNAQTKTQTQVFIKVEDEESQYNIFNLSNEGILSALIVSNWDVKLVWWRTDTL